MDQGRAVTGCSGMAMEGRAGKAAQGPLMRFTGVRNDKARGGLGLDGTGSRFYACD